MRHSQAHSSNFYHIFSANALRDPPMTSVVTVYEGVQAPGALGFFKKPPRF